jgi:hypothetical protein
MNADRRIVPEKHLSYLLEEDRILERTQKVKHSLGHSHKKIDRVADKWIEPSGINSLARVILKNVDNIPSEEKHLITRTHPHSAPTKDIHKEHGPVVHTPTSHQDEHDEHHLVVKAIDHHTLHEEHKPSPHTSHTSHEAHTEH